MEGERRALECGSIKRSVTGRVDKEDKKQIVADACAARAAGSLAQW